MGLVADQVAKVHPKLGWSVKFGKLFFKISRSRGMLSKADKVFTFALDHINTTVSWTYIFVKAAIISRIKKKKVAAAKNELMNGVPSFELAEEDDDIYCTPAEVAHHIQSAVVTDKASIERLASYVFLYQCLLIESNQDLEVVEPLLDVSSRLSTVKTLGVFFSSNLSLDLVNAVRSFNGQFLTNSRFHNVAAAYTRAILMDTKGKTVRSLVEWVV